ncbi:MAG: peptidoglycan bridge formation glycyltransferase FemA/FemB family protein [Patescibacteria group bacterium]
MIMPDRETWNRYVLAHGGEFLQSWEWGQFQVALGRTVHRYRDQSAAALVINQSLPLGQHYWSTPRGPVGTNATALSQQIVADGRAAGVVFWRVEPPLAPNPPPLLPSHPTSYRQPHQTLVLDLTPSLDDLLATCHPKTRYNIRLAAKHGVTVRRSVDARDIDIFWQLSADTASRQQLRLHDRHYYQTMLATLGQTATNTNGLRVELFIAEHQGRAVAANLVAWFGETVTYLHGGSRHDHRELMAPHLLQWTQIKAAQAAGATRYDCWGYDEQIWPGVSRFKAGFGGERITYPTPREYPLSRRYRWYVLAKKLLA